MVHLELTAFRHQCNIPLLKTTFNCNNTTAEEIDLKFRNALLRTFVLSLAFTASVFGFGNGNSFQAVFSIQDNLGDAIIGATVAVTVGGRTLATGTTDSNGEFGLPLEAGNYEIKVNSAGFEESSKAITVSRDEKFLIELDARSLAEVVSITSNYLAGTGNAIERTPGTIGIVSKETLEDSRVFNFSEALRKVAGVQIRGEEGFGLRPNISIRGSNPTRSRKVLLLEDGLPLSYAPYGDNSSYYHPPIERFESVEVLKGSGQIEYGPVTVAGVVNYLTPNPTEDFTGFVETTGGNRDFFNGNAGLSGSFGKNGILLNFVRKQGEGARANLRSAVNDFSAKFIRTINDSNIITVKYSHFDESSRLTYSGLTEAEFASDPRQNPFRNDDLEFFREGFSASHTGVFNERASLTTTFYTSYFSRDWWRQSSNSSQRPNTLGIDPDCNGLEDLSTTCGIIGTPRDFRTSGVESRLRMSVPIGNFRNEFTIGGRFHYETQNRRRFLGFTPFAREEGSTVQERNLRNALAGAFFIQNQFVFGKFTVTPGLRVERIRYERSNLLNQQSASTSLTELIPGIGFAYNVGSRVTLFGGVHRGFAPPSTSDILTNNGGVVELDPERSWSYEAGVRARPTEYIRFETAFFRNDYENQIIAASVAGGVGSTRTNGGQTLQQGIETTFRLDSSPFFRTNYNLYFQSAYTLLANASFEGQRFSSVSGFNSVSVEGNRLPYVPRHTATSQVGLEFRGFNGFVENVYVSSQFTDDLNTFDPIPNGQRGLIGSQLYFNATANYRFESLKSTIFFTAKNITDRLFIVDRTRGIYPGIPRLIQVGFKYSF